LNEDNQAGGKAKILTTAEIQLLFTDGFTVNPPRDLALFAICLPSVSTCSRSY
jgi:hypothetical protein